MRNKFFIKNLLLFILPLLIPILTLGSYAIFITQNFITTEINKNNEKILMQTRNTVELLFNELDTLSLSFSLEPYITLRLKELLGNQSLNYNELDTLSLIKSITDPPINSKPFIESVYVYIENNRNNFFVSNGGLANLDSFGDTSWFDSFAASGSQLRSWIETRKVERDGFDLRDKTLISIYRKLYLPGTAKATGVIVVNIKSSYVENILNGLITSDRQAVLITNSNSEIVSSSTAGMKPGELEVKEINAHSSSFFNLTLHNETYVISQIDSEKYELKYVSVVPQKTLYKVSEQVGKFTIVLLLLSFLLGLALTYYMTRRNYNNIQNMVVLFDSAEKGNPLPSVPSRINNEYGYIMQNMVKTFIEQNFLKVQLSEKKYKLKTMEMLALQSQINPHFLFNTLRTIFWKTVRLTGDQNDASNMLEALSEILHYSLGNPDKTVTFAEEIKNTCSYIEIQQIRYENKFGVIWHYADKIEQHQVIKLLFQPLIENCIYHGMREKEEPGYIKIKINQVGSNLRIAVIDNGLGMAAAKLAAVRERLQGDREYSEHIGLMNTNKRLKLTYGEGYGIRITSKSGWGTVVSITIPAVVEER